MIKKILPVAILVVGVVSAYFLIMAGIKPDTTNASMDTRLFCGHNDMPRLVEGKWICWGPEQSQKWWEHQTVSGK